ncbi:hypothetical protein YC2023_057956 [Brassica napus]
MADARVSVGSRIIVQSHFSHRKNSLIHVVSVSQLVEKLEQHSSCEEERNM